MSNEFKLSHGSRERKRRQSITLTAIEIERLASEGAHCFHFILHNSSFNLFIRRLGVGCSYLVRFHFLRSLFARC
jgi:hypothetical protein